MNYPALMQHHLQGESRVMWGKAGDVNQALQLQSFKKVHSDRKISGRCGGKSLCRSIESQRMTIHHPICFVLSSQLPYSQYHRGWNELAQAAIEIKVRRSQAKKLLRKPPWKRNEPTLFRAVLLFSYTVSTPLKPFSCRVRFTIPCISLC